MRKLYEEIEEFREYVDRYSRSRGISVDLALTHKLVIEYGRELAKTRGIV